MSDFVLKWYIRLFDMLSIKYKVELISRLADRLKDSFDNEEIENEEQKREKALEAMIKLWRAIDLDSDFVVNSRTVSERTYGL